jgi:acyl dehydratase
MVFFDDIHEGDEIPSFTFKMTWEMYKRYNRFVKENNALHFSKKYATSIGFRDIVVAGVFTYSFFVRPILEWLNDISAVKQVKIRFHKPIYIEDEITQGATVVKKYVNEGVKLLECEMWIRNQENGLVSSGSALISLNK